jgi:signal transduction histidine kinase
VKRRNATFVSVAAGLVVLALLATFALELANTQAKSKGDVTDRVRERAVLAAALIDSLFQTTGQQAPQNARKYGDRTVTAARMEANHGQNSYVVLLDSSGRVLAHSRGFTSQARSNLAGSVAVRLVRSGRLYGLGDIRPYGRRGVVDLAVAVPTRFGRRILLTGFEPTTLSTFIGGELRKIPGVKGARSYLVDGRNAVIASNDPALKSGQTLAIPDQLETAARRSGAVSGRYYEQVGLASSTWRIVLVAPEGALFASVAGVRKWVPWMIFAAFALVTIVAFMLARRALRAADEVRDGHAQLEIVNTELATMNTTLERRAAELARSNDELDQFASIASHDLQEPLRKVRTFTERVTVMESEHLTAQGRDYLQRANAAAERMQNLIEDLLRFSRVSTNARPFAFVDLAAVTREVLVDLETEVERCGAVVRVGDLPAISGDAMQLRQLIQNLVSNALKFRRAGVAPEVAIDAVVAAQTATITVRDNGIGFDPQYSRRIFRVFERLNGRGEYPGTGIGLALCRKIVERHGGAVAADSEPGVGSMFTVTLPVDQREEVIANNFGDNGARSAREEEEAVHA